MNGICRFNRQRQEMCLLNFSFEMPILNALKVVYICWDVMNTEIPQRDIDSQWMLSTPFSGIRWLVNWQFNLGNCHKIISMQIFFRLDELIYCFIKQNTVGRYSFDDKNYVIRFYLRFWNPLNKQTNLNEIKKRKSSSWK